VGFSGVPRSNLRGADPGPSPPTRYVEAANSVDRLEALNDRANRVLAVVGDADLPAVTSLGIDDPSNTLAIGLLEDTQAHRAAVLEALCASPSEVSFTQEDPATPL